MRLIAPARLTERLQERSAQLDRLAQAMAQTVSVWRMRLARHRVAIAVLGGGIAGVSLGISGGSLVRAAMQLSAALVRAAALSAIARARVRYAVSRATRKVQVP